MPRGNNEVTPGNELPPGLAPRQELPNHIAACRRVSSASDCLHEQSTLARALLTYGCQGRHDREGTPRMLRPPARAHQSTFHRSCDSRRPLTTHTAYHPSRRHLPPPARPLPPL